MKKRFLALGMTAVLTVTGICGVDTAKYAKADNTEQVFGFERETETLKAGSKYKFTVSGADEEVRWSVSDKKYAIVSQKGILTGKRVGKVTLTAICGTNKISCKVKIEGKKKVAIDAGHQSVGDSSTEPVGPGSSTRKAKVAGGACGVATGVPEYKFTLSMAKKLRKQLIDRGYDVYMIRDKNDVNISNKQRALNANNSGSDIYIRLHGDSIGSSSVTGASALYPSKNNRYVGKLSSKSYKLSKKVLESYCKKTGIRNRGCVVRDDLTGTNWSKIPVTLIEMGFMSNSSEDRKMQQRDFQITMAEGLADGIDAYFGY